MQAQAQTGDKVRIKYTAKLDDGRIFAAQRDDTGVEFTLGQGQVIPGLEKTVLGMKPGETKTTAVAPEDAFGVRDAARVVTVDESAIPSGVEPKPGLQLSLQHPSGKSETVVIANVHDGKVVLDANHPLAGKHLTLEVTLLDIN